MDPSYINPDRSVYAASRKKMSLQRFVIIAVTAVLLVAFVTKSVNTYTDLNTVERVALPIAIGIASMFSATHLSTSESVQSGLILGGVLLVFYSVSSHWGTINDNIKVLILGGALSAVVYGGTRILA